MADSHFKAGQGALWVQPYGPATEPLYLGCHSVGDIEQPEGDIDLIYCPDPSGPDKFVVTGSVKGAAGAITTTVTADIVTSLDYLETVECPFTLFVNVVEKGRRDVFTNYIRSFVLVNSNITSRSVSGLLTRTPDDNARSEQSFEISAEELLRIAAFTISTQTTTETAAMTDISSCGDERCRTPNYVARSACQYAYASTGAPSGSPGEYGQVWKTINGGTWTAVGGEPFEAAVAIAAIRCIEMGGDDFRVLVARGTSDAGALDVAYSDDAGENWTEVTLGSTNGEYVVSSHALFVRSRNAIYVGTDQGNIYFSDNAGVSFSIQLAAGTITSDPINCIRFVDDQVGWMGGDSEILARTLDGGTSWSTITGPGAETGNNVLVVNPLDQNRVWVGYDSGSLYYTEDGGSTWTEFAFSGSGTGEVRDVRFYNDLLGFMAWNSAAPGSGGSRVYYTIDGGYTWQSISTPTNTGLNKLLICNQWNFFLVGNAVAGVGLIAKGSAA